jgi:hypothetical protein
MNWFEIVICGRYFGMTSTRNHELLLVERFVASFDKLDEMLAHEHLDPVAWQLAIGDPDQFGRKPWRPAKANTEVERLEPIYLKLPARFPPLFERLVLSYRWAEIDLQSYRLLANPPGPDLNGLLQQMSKDLILWNCLLRSGHIPFGKGPDVDYDPICFDIGSRKKNGDCRIVKIDHEQILCNDRVKVIAELAPSFEQLMLRTIDKVDHE